jgi:hypothetical protein
MQEENVINKLDRDCLANSRAKCSKHTSYHKAAEVIGLRSSNESTNKLEITSQ